MADNSAKLKAEIAYLTSMLRYFTFLIIFLVYFVIFNEVDIISDIILRTTDPVVAILAPDIQKVLTLKLNISLCSEFVLKDFSL